MSMDNPSYKWAFTFPDFGVRHHWLDFLVDTGAVATALMPTDGRLVRIDYEAVRDRVKPEDLTGAGKGAKGYPVNAIVALFDESGAISAEFEVELLIFDPDTVPDGVPSLLGRDVLNKCRMNYNFRDGGLELDVSG